MVLWTDRRTRCDRDQLFVCYVGADFFGGVGWSGCFSEIFIDWFLVLCTCMIYIYIYMEDCAFTCSCLDCHPDILNEAFKKILKIQNGKRAFGPAWRKKKGISIQFTFRNDWRFQIAVTLNSPRGIEFFSRELSSRR